jgi:hypothetical protein
MPGLTFVLFGVRTPGLSPDLEQKKESPTLLDGAFQTGKSLVTLRLVVVFQAEMGDELRTHDVAQGVLELHQLDEQVVFRVEPLACLR